MAFNLNAESLSLNDIFGWEHKTDSEFFPVVRYASDLPDANGNRRQPAQSQISCAVNFFRRCDQESFFKRMDLWIDRHRQKEFAEFPESFPDAKDVCLENIRKHYSIEDVTFPESVCRTADDYLVFVALQTNWQDMSHEMALSVSKEAIRCLKIADYSGTHVHHVHIEKMDIDQLQKWLNASEEYFDASQFTYSSILGDQA